MAQTTMDPVEMVRKTLEQAARELLGATATAKTTRRLQREPTQCHLRAAPLFDIAVSLPSASVEWNGVVDRAGAA